METTISSDFFNDVENLTVDNDGLTEVLQENTTEFSGNLSEIDNFNEEEEETSSDEVFIEEEEEEEKKPIDLNLLRGQSKSIVSMLELGNAFVLPKIYEKRRLSNADKKILEAIKQKEVLNPSVVTYTPQEVDVLNKVAKFEDYKNNIKFTAEEKQQLADEFYNYLKYQQISMNPMSSLIMALVMIEGIRILPILGIEI